MSLDGELARFGFVWVRTERYYVVEPLRVRGFGSYSSGTRELDYIVTGATVTVGRSGNVGLFWTGKAGNGRHLGGSIISNDPRLDQLRDSILKHNAGVRDDAARAVWNAERVERQAAEADRLRRLDERCQ